MSIKVTDNKNRWRNKIVSFRASPEEANQINILSSLSGLTKQEYLIRRVLEKDIIVNANSRIYKMLTNQMNEVLNELKRLQKISTDEEELLDLILYISEIVNDLKGDID